MIYDPLPQMGFIGTTGDLGMFAGSRRKLGRRACGQLVLNILEKIGGCSLFRPAKTFPISGTTFGSRIHQKKHNTRNSHLPKYILLDTSLLIWSNLVPRTKSLPHLLQSWCSRSKSGGILSTLEAGFDRCADHKSIAENQLPCLSHLKSFTCRSGDQGHGVLVWRNPHQRCWFGIRCCCQWFHNTPGF